MRKTLFFLLLLGCVPRQMQAQFLGYTAPQTNSQVLATNVACTGAPQNFPVNNFGQIFHSAQLTSIGGTVTNLSMVIQASTDGIVFANISDTVNGTQALATAGFGVTASGYYTIVRVSVTCNGTAGALTFSLVYSGIAGGANPPGGAFLQASIDKQLLRSASAGSTFSSQTFSTPFGSSSGQLIFGLSGGAAGSTGASLKVTCTNSSNFNNFVSTYALGTLNGTTQSFTVPASPCEQYNVTYTAGGASTELVSIDYIFSPLGVSNSSTLYSPDMLGVNAITEPGAGTSALSNIVEMRGVKQAVLKFSCTAGAITVNVQTYQEDGATTSTLISPLSGVAAATLTDLTIGSESNSSSSSGTLSTTALVRLPQRAMAFSFTNAGGAGTCTARLFLSY